MMGYSSDISPAKSGSGGGLQKETEKLVRLKMETEMETNETERKLSQASDLAESQKLTILSLEKEKDQLQTKYSSMQQGREELEERVASTKKEVEVVSRQVDVLKNQLRFATTLTESLERDLQEKNEFVERMPRKFSEMCFKHQAKIQAGSDKCTQLEEEKLSSLQLLHQKESDLENGLAELSDQFSGLEVTLTKKRKDVDKNQELIEQKDAEIQQNKEEISDLAEMKLRLAAEMAEKIALVRSDIEGMNGQKQRQEDTVDDLKAKLETKTKEKEEVSGKLSALRAEKQGVEAELTIVLAGISDLQGKMSSLMVEMESEARVNNDLNLKMKELSKLKIDYKMLKDDLSVSDDRNKSLEDDIANLSKVEKEKLELNTRILDLEKELFESSENYRERLASLESNLKDSKLRLDECVERSAAASSGHETAISGLKTELRDTSNQFQALDEELAERKAESTKLEAELAITRSAVINSTEALDKNTKEKITLSTEIERVRSEIEFELETKRSLVQNLSQCLGETTTNAESQAQTIDRFIQEIENLKNLKMAGETELSSTRSELVEIKAGLEIKLNNQHTQEKNIAMGTQREGEVIEQTERIVAQINGLKNQTAQQEALMQEEKNKTSTFHLVDDENNRYKEESSSLDHQLDNLAQEKDGLEQQENGLREKLAALKQQRAREEEDAEAYKNNVHQNFKQMEEDRKQSLDKILKDYDSLEAEFEKKKRSLEEQGVQNRVLEADLLHHTKELDNLKKENTDIVNQLVDLEKVDNVAEDVRREVNVHTAEKNTPSTSTRPRRMLLDISSSETDLSRRVRSPAVPATPRSTNVLPRQGNVSGTPRRSPSFANKSWSQKVSGSNVMGNNVPFNSFKKPMPALFKKQAEKEETLNFGFSSEDDY